MQIQRLNAQAVAAQNQFALARIPDCKREHPSELIDETLAIFLIEVKDDFRVGRGAEDVRAFRARRAIPPAL